MSYQKGAFSEEMIPEGYCKGCSEPSIVTLKKKFESKNIPLLHYTR